MSDLTDDQKKASITRFIADQPKPMHPEYEDKYPTVPDIHVAIPMKRGTEYRPYSDYTDDPDVNPTTKPKTIPGRVLRKGVCFFCNADVTTYARDLPDLEETNEEGLTIRTTDRAAGIIQAHGELLVVPPEEWARITLDVFTEHVGPWLERYHEEQQRLQQLAMFLCHWADGHKLDIVSGKPIVLRSMEFPSLSHRLPQTTPANETADSEPTIPEGWEQVQPSKLLKLRPNEDPSTAPGDESVDSGLVD